MDQEFWSEGDEYYEDCGSAPEGFTSEPRLTIDRYDQWRQAFAWIESLRLLRQNWDGDGASPPSSLCVATALRTLNMSRIANDFPPSRIVPGLDGAIIIEWHRPNYYLEAEISEPGTVEWMEKLNNQPARHCEWNLSGEMKLEAT